MNFSFSDLHDFERCWVEAISEFHHLLRGLAKHVIPHEFLVCGQVVQKPLHVGPLAFPRGQGHRSRRKVPGEGGGREIGLKFAEVKRPRGDMFICSFFLGTVTALGVLCCFALFVCLALLASFFLPSHLSLKHVYMYIHMYSTCTKCKG